MKSISFSKDQFLALLKLVYVGNWIINAGNTSDQKIQEFEEIENYLLDKVNDFGLEDLVIQDELGVFPTGAFEAMMHEYIDEYENESFWETLAEELATKEFLLSYDKATREKMSRTESFLIRSELIDKYQEILSKDGLKNFGKGAGPAILRFLYKKSF